MNLNCLLKLKLTRKRLHYQRKINGRLPEFEEAGAIQTLIMVSLIVHCGLAFSILITEKRTELVRGHKHLKLKFLFVDRIKTELKLY